MAHTAGPWSFIDNSWEMSTVYGQDGELVAECPINSEVDEETQDEFEAVKDANARLIAAAPDLLEALRHAREVVAAHCDGIYEVGVLEDIDAAISKATGGK